MGRLTLCLAAMLVLGCEKHPEARGTVPSLTAGLARTLRQCAQQTLTEHLQTPERCLEEIATISRTPALPGAPGLERARAGILARAKGEPVLFWRAPQPPPDLTSEARSYRAELERARPPHPVLSRLRKAARGRTELARQVLLREGYLYAEDPELALALVEYVELGDLFDAPELVIQRGGELQRAVREDNAKYRYSSGPFAGKRASLILNDRVWAADEAPQPELHVDVKRLSEQLGFERLRVLHLSAGKIAVELRYAGVWVPTLLSVQGPALERVCEATPRGHESRVSDARELARRQAAVLRLKRRAMVEQIEDSLPFDEPKTEDGQQDGNLRPQWLWAYTNGWDSYKFNDDRYQVFDTRGRPRVPQVCVDFITDTLERASGTYFRERGPVRERVRGQLDFNELELDNRRSVDRFVGFAEAHPTWFDVYRLLPEERVPYRRRELFYAHLVDHAERYLPGDIIVIHGLRDDEEYHYHSFFVFDSDPVSGVPTLLAANAGRPRIRTWDGEMRSAPRRSIRMRVRPRLEWLESVLPVGGSLSRAEPEAAPPGVSG